MSPSRRSLSADRKAYDEPAGAAAASAARAGRGDTVMQQQGPNGMGGPLRGTSVWWHGRSEETQSSVSEEPPCSRGSKRQYENDPTIRHELVERVRREIAAGDYDTPKRWEAALDRLLDRLHRE